jgi:hypothetical protein
MKLFLVYINRQNSGWGELVQALSIGEAREKAEKLPAFGGRTSGAFEIREPAKKAGGAKKSKP